MDLIGGSVWRSIIGSGSLWNGWRRIKQEAL